MARVETVYICAQQMNLWNQLIDSAKLSFLKDYYFLIKFIFNPIVCTHLFWVGNFNYTAFVMLIMSLTSIFGTGHCEKIDLLGEHAKI